MIEDSFFICIQTKIVQFHLWENCFSFEYKQYNKVRQYIIRWLQTCRDRLACYSLIWGRDINALSKVFDFEWSWEFNRAFGTFLWLQKKYIQREGWSRYLWNCCLRIWAVLIGSHRQIRTIGLSCFWNVSGIRDRGLCGLRRSLLNHGGFGCERPIAELLTYSVKRVVWRDSRAKRFVVRERSVALSLVLHRWNSKKQINFRPESNWKLIKRLVYKKKSGHLISYELGWTF